MIQIRNSKELELMKTSGAIAASALKKVLLYAKEGMTGLELNRIATEEIYSLGGDLSYKTVPGYPYGICVTINEQVVHGLPTDRKFIRGDVVSVDLAVSFKGWHTDTAWTVLIGEAVGFEEKISFLKVGKTALKKAVGEAIEGRRVGDISYAIQSTVEESGFHVVRSLVGHGVGRKLHEDPQIPGYGVKGSGPRLQEGITLAIEVIYAQGTSEVILGSDGWTYSAADGSLSGLFEVTVVVGKKTAKVLTDWRKVD